MKNVDSRVNVNIRASISLLVFMIVFIVVFVFMFMRVYFYPIEVYISLLVDCSALMFSQ